MKLLYVLYMSLMVSLVVLLVTAPGCEHRRERTYVVRDHHDRTVIVERDRNPHRVVVEKDQRHH